MPSVSKLFKQFKIAFRRKAPAASGSQYPLGLTGAEWVALKELVGNPGWAAYRTLLERYGELRAQRLLQPLPIDQTNVERGAVAALFEVAALPETLITHMEALNARRTKLGADESADLYWRWGNPLFADDFRSFRSPSTNGGGDA